MRRRRASPPSVLLPLSVGFLVAALVGALWTRVARDLAVRLGHLDHPDERKVHAEAVPRVGGIGIAAGIAAGALVVVLLSPPGADWVPLAALAVGAGVVFALGLVDDVVGLGFKWRFVVQSGVAWAMTLAGWHVDLSNVVGFSGLSDTTLTAIEVPLTVVWTVGLINAVNLLDGLDALAGGTALIGFAALALSFLPAQDPVLLTTCVVGAAAVLGFLGYNRPPASVFMGDGGSTLLGFLLAMSAVRGVSVMPWGGLVILPVIALGLPILDTLTQMVRRVSEGKSPFLPDRDHLHHRAYDRSGNVRVAVLKLHLTAAIFGALAFALRLASGVDWLQGVVMLATLAFAYAVVRRLGYVRPRDLARAARLLFWRRARARRDGRLGSDGEVVVVAPEAAFEERPSGDGQSTALPTLD